MRLSGFFFGMAVGATLMYLFDPRQGAERREVWGERVRKGREQAQSAYETGRERVDEIRHHAEEAGEQAKSAVDGAREQVTTFTSDEETQA